ncbi:MAG TPA: glutamine synthetase family protein [Bacteroidales bacterium]|nr:glutamine synthetase family protein [Bacteroidales bacterium]HPT21100.1 glutamine synthetase family protein [Bacteroidales bacterium]
MENSDIQSSRNELEQFLNKSAKEFTSDDIVRFIEKNNIRMINFRYAAEDGKLKTLNFVPHNHEHLVSILTEGERVDGSSLFSFVEAGSSDLYVIPRYRTAFVNPFTEDPSLEILCSFYNSDGRPLESSPEYILRKAYRRFRENTGLTMKALGELEYYVRSDSETLYPLVDQKGYHQSKPFSKYEDLRTEAMGMCAAAGCHIKYGHSEVGSFTRDGEDFEQHEIEFLPVEVDHAVEQILIAKWILRMLSYEYNVELSFAPKITTNGAGSGMHIHLMLEKDGLNIMNQNGRLSDTARKMIAGLLDLSKALTAFGNTIPTSYLRLVPHQEAPTDICWGDRNRSVLVRVPLGWTGSLNMVYDSNPSEPVRTTRQPSRQTVELRSPDGSADIYLLMAGIVVAVEHGLEMENALKIAENLYVDHNVTGDKKKDNAKKFEGLPTSCWASADALIRLRSYFENDGVFPPGVIDNIARRLKSYNDENLMDELLGNKETLTELVKQYLHCG